MSEPVVEVIIGPVELAEGPHWDAPSQSLYFVDIHLSYVHKYHPQTKQHTKAKVGDGPVSLIIPLADAKDEFLISHRNGLATITWDGISDKVDNYRFLRMLDPNPCNRLNDGKTSPSGIFLAGSMGPEQPDGNYPKDAGSLYVYKNEVVKELLTNVGISNGLAWTQDERTFYYIDSYKYKVEAFDFDSQALTLTNNRTIVDFAREKIEGIPDGMTIDSQGNLWVACFGASQILKVNPEIGIEMKIPLPSAQITSAAFGGPNLDELYVTSAYYQQSNEYRSRNKHSGAIFKITNLGVNGLTGVPFALK